MERVEHALRRTLRHAVHRRKLLDARLLDLRHRLKVGQKRRPALGTDAFDLLQHAAERFFRTQASVVSDGKSVRLVAQTLERLERSRIASVLIYGFLTVVSVAYLVDATYNPFLYFRF